MGATPANLCLSWASRMLPDMTLLEDWLTVAG
jgi:hypothetical protein